MLLYIMIQFETVQAVKHIFPCSFYISVVLMIFKCFSCLLNVKWFWLLQYWIVQLNEVFKRRTLQ